MKIYQLLLILLIINYIYSESVSCSNTHNPTQERCKAALYPEDLERGYKYCCFVRYKELGDNEEKTECEPITEYQYKNIDEYVKFYKLFEIKSDDFNIECGSNFFKFSFLSLILLLL